MDRKTDRKTDQMCGGKDRMCGGKDRMCEEQACYVIVDCLFVQ